MESQPQNPELGIILKNCTHGSLIWVHIIFNIQFTSETKQKREQRTI